MQSLHYPFCSCCAPKTFVLVSVLASCDAWCLAQQTEHGNQSSTVGRCERSGQSRYSKTPKQFIFEYEQFMCNIHFIFKYSHTSKDYDSKIINSKPCYKKVTSDMKTSLLYPIFIKAYIVMCWYRKKAYQVVYFVIPNKSSQPCLLCQGLIVRS